MRFVKRIDDVGKAYVHLDLQGLQLPGFNFDYTPFLDFHIETYLVLKSKSDDFAWNVVFKTTHDFLDSLPEEEQIQFAKTIVLMHYEIVNKLYTDEIAEFNRNLVPLETTLSNWLSELDNKISLVPKLRQWTERNIPIQSFVGVGERPQDSAATTFYRDDVVELTTLVLVCKMMTPIFGIFIEACKKKIGNNLKEIHCLAITKKLFKERFDTLISKLGNFIVKIMKPILNRLDPTHLFNGYTFTTASDEVYARLIVRQYVTVDLFKTNGNLMTYTTSCIRAAARTQFSPMGFKTAARDRALPKEQLTINDEGNSSNLEAESRSSSRTADYGITIRAAAYRAYLSFKTEYDMSDELLEHCFHYYSVNHVDCTPYNLFILGILFGTQIGGAKGIAMVEPIMYMRLVAAAQIYFIQVGFLDLVHPLSMQSTGLNKALLTGNDTQLRAMWNASHEYKICENRYSWAIGELRWDTRLKEIVDLITTTRFIYNTAPGLWDMMHLESANGEQYSTSADLSRQICAFIADGRE